MTSSIRLVISLVLLTWLQVAVEASDQQIVYIRNTCECWNTDLKCVCKIESDPTSVRPLMQRLVNRTAEYYWQEVEFQSMVYDRTTFILANTFADGPFPSGITFKGDFSIVNDSFNHLNMTLNKVELNFETFSGRKPKFSKQYWRYIFDHGEATLRTLRIIKYQIEDFIIPNYLGAALTQEVRPLTEFKVVGCEVKEVKERAFKNFTQLEVLDLSDNHLTTLPENVFSRNINLQKILLANNQISFLTKTIFDGLPNLLLINLRKNKLTAVPAIPRHTNRRFQPMVYLMADNSIHCRCSLIWVLHELTFHHNLEIEATCSDPTMVRGMPIIEGFTRMDKEACYRTVRKEDGTVERQYQHLPGSVEHQNSNQIGAGQTSVATLPVQQQQQQQHQQQHATPAGVQLAGKSGDASLSSSSSSPSSSASLPLSLTPAEASSAAAAVAAESAKSVQEPQQKLGLAQPTSADLVEQRQQTPNVVAVPLAPPNQVESLATISRADQAASPIDSAAAVAPAPIPHQQPQHLQSVSGESSFIQPQQQQPLATLISHSVPSSQSIESIAPQAPVSSASADITQPAAAAFAGQSAAAPAAASSPSQAQAQLVNVAPQTVLTPSHSVVEAPVAAVAPPAASNQQAASSNSIHPQQHESSSSLVAHGSKPAAVQ